MSDLLPTVYLFRAEHAVKLRAATLAILSGRPGVLDYRWPAEVLEVLMLMDDLADKIERTHSQFADTERMCAELEQKRLPANVVEFRRK